MRATFSDEADSVSGVSFDPKNEIQKNEGRVSRKEVPDPGLRLTSTCCAVAACS